ncbi:hypothetical protein [Metapseudomonas furukawaii]
MSLKAVAVAASCTVAIAFAGCTTRYQGAPVERYTMPTAPVEVVNAQIDKEPRVLFSDGITTYMTDYRGWAEIMRYKIASAVAGLPVTQNEKKNLSVSINQIDCGGHYVSDCSISIMVETGAGHREIINSRRFNGYPLTSAVEKALDDAAGKIRINRALMEYLLKG